MQEGGCQVVGAGVVIPKRSIGSKLSYSAWTQVFLNQTGPPVELRVEHLLPGSMSKAWEHWEDRAGVET